MNEFSKRLRTAMTLRNMQQVDLVEKTKLGKSAISQYVSGKYEPKQKAIYLIAKALDVNEAWLMGFDVDMEKTAIKYPDNIYKIENKSFPMLGNIAAGQPLFVNEEHEAYVVTGSDIHADFCLKVKGDSMINARILDGDIVFIRQQPTVEDGEIAAVLIGNEATLKRVYLRENEIMLVAENSAYKPLIYKNEELNSVRILGKAVSFQSIL